MGGMSVAAVVVAESKASRLLPRPAPRLRATPAQSSQVQPHRPVAPAGPDPAARAPACAHAFAAVRVHPGPMRPPAARAAPGPKVSSATTTPTRVQRVAPAAPAAAVGIGALAGKCIVGALLGAVVDLAIQAGLHLWRRGWDRMHGFRVDYCGLILSAVLGCVGGVAAARWLEPWINRALGARLGAVGGPLVGRILLFVVQKLGIGVPRAVLKTLLKLGCVSPEQAEAMAPGLGAEVVAEVDSAATEGLSGSSGRHHRERDGLGVRPA